MAYIKIEQLSISVENKEILHNVDLELNSGQIAFLLGRNGAGKSSFAQTVMGNPWYTRTNGRIIISNDEEINIIDLNPEDRSKLGLFVSFQNPPEIEGISMISYLHTIYVEKFGNEDVLSRSTFKFRKHILKLLERVGLPQNFLERSLNIGFSGGEKKRSEILQILLLKPSVIILDEIDSGLDVHSMKMLNEVVNEATSEGAIVLYISHNVEFIKSFVNPYIFILDKGSITSRGSLEVLEKFISNE
ncbi:MAG: Fe-S cluster assembly ATPase SufC [bacterium]